MQQAQQAGPPDPQSWEKNSEGWWLHHLDEDACQTPRCVHLPAPVFEELAGRPLSAEGDELVASDAFTGAIVVLPVKPACGSGHSTPFLQGGDLCSWLASAGAKAGNVLAFKRKNGRLLLRHIPGNGEVQAARAPEAGRPTNELRRGLRRGGRQAPGAVKQGGASGLPFTPEATASIAAALVAPLAGPKHLQGVKQTGRRWGAWISRSDTTTSISCLSLQRMAVAADIILLWHLAPSDSTYRFRFPWRKYNFPQAGYGEDAPLRAQIRQVQSAAQMKLFLQCVLAQCPADDEQPPAQQEDQQQGPAPQLQKGCKRQWQGEADLEQQQQQQQQAGPEQGKQQQQQQQQPEQQPEQQKQDQGQPPQQQRQQHSTWSNASGSRKRKQRDPTRLPQAHTSQCATPSAEAAGEAVKRQRRADNDSAEGEPSGGEPGAGAEPVALQAYEPGLAAMPADQHAQQQPAGGVAQARRRYYRGPRLSDADGPLVVMTHGGSTPLYVPLAAVGREYERRGGKKMNFGGSVERRALDSETPCFIKATPQERRLLVAEGCMPARTSHARWALLTTVIRTLQPHQRLAGAGGAALLALHTRGTADLPRLWLSQPNPTGEGGEVAAAAAAATVPGASEEALAQQPGIAAVPSFRQASQLLPLAPPPPPQQQQAPAQQRQPAESRRLFLGPRLTATDAPLVVLLVCQAGGGTALYVPRLQVVREVAHRAASFAHNLTSLLRRRWQAGDPPCFIDALAPEVKTLSDQGCLRHSGYCVKWVLLPVVNRGLQGSKRVGPEAERALRQLEERGTEGLEELRPAHHCQQTAEGVAAAAAAAAGHGAAAAAAAGHGAAGAEAAGQGTAAAAAAGHRAPAVAERPRPFSRSAARQALLLPPQSPQLQQVQQQQQQQPGQWGITRLISEGGSYHSAPPLTQDGPPLLVLATTQPGGGGDGGSTALFVLRIQVRQAFVALGGNTNMFTVLVEGQRQPGEPPCFMKATAIERQLLVTQGCVKLHDSRPMWALLPAVSRVLRGQLSVQPSVQQAGQAVLAALTLIEVEGIGRLPQLWLEAAAAQPAQGEQGQEAARRPDLAAAAASAAAEAAPACAERQPVGGLPGLLRQEVEELPPTQPALPARQAPEAQQAQQVGQQAQQGQPGQQEEQAEQQEQKMQPGQEGQAQQQQKRQEQLAQQAQQEEGQRQEQPAQQEQQREEQRQPVQGEEQQQRRQGKQAQQAQHVQRQQQQQPAASPAAGPRPASTPAAPTAVPAGLSPHAHLRLAELAAAEQQASVLRAAEAFEGADRCCPASMLRPLKHLVLADRGGDTLQGLVERWHLLPLVQQQAVFGAALVVTSRGSWERLEGRLQLAVE